ncbi:MAG: hypothetical protein COA52_00830 [Hyphomicrobiales bacterium]|nr:MAG: hypothetical protein COA52_00830 [Hyphomicrobiales bacterium]
MHNFKQYLEEGRDAPLYHATNFDGAQGISFYNKIKGSSNFDIKHKQSHKKFARGVSLSRSLKAAINYIKRLHGIKNGGIFVFELDQRKLSQRYKIQPYNFWYKNANTEKSTGEKIIRHQTRNTDMGRQKQFGNEYEEFVTGMIDDVNKYIIKIHYLGTKKELNSLNQGTSHEDDIFNHPKLFVNRKFING